MMKKILFTIFLTIAAFACQAKAPVQPLPSEQAFSFSAELTKPDQLTLQWKIAPGYYLYKNQFQLLNDQSRAIPLNLPKGIIQHDSVHGTYQSYTNILKITVPLPPSDQNSANFTIQYQGCSTQNFCYNTIKKVFQFNASPPAVAQFVTSAVSMPPEEFYSEQASAEMLFSKHSLLLTILSFLGLGLLLAFTPCVLPMVPILYGIIIGHRKKNPSGVKAFSLSLAYVLGMAITYAIAGMIVALIGSRIQTELQRPWIIVLFSGIFVLMALSLFGLYEFQLPSRLQKWLTQLSNQQKSGTYIGVFLMGSISTLIVSPCISPALIGVLAYIAHTGNVWIGAFALLSLAIGMGLPLLLIGVSANKLLPKTGVWMQTIEHLVGIMLLGFAIWLLARIIPGPQTLLLWAALLIGSAIMMGEFAKAFSRWQLIRHTLATIALIYGIILLFGAALGNSNPLHPWENWRLTSKTEVLSSQPMFMTIHSMTQLNQMLEEARQEKKWVMIDFYADWCESCVHMDRYVFAQKRVKEALSNFVLLRGDITADNAFDNVLMRSFQVIAPPTMLFMTPTGKELHAARLIGEVTADELLEHLQKLKETTSGHAS